jgi:ABC-type amino acid transport substrate-binding protein
MSRLHGAALCALLLAGTALAASPTLDRIAATGTITFGYRDGAAPFSFRDRTGGVRGYSVDLCVRIAAGIQAALGLPGLKVEWKPVDAATRIDAVVSGKVDAECGTTTITLKRMERVDFSLPIFVDGASLLTRGQDRVTRLTDLAGKRVAVIAGTTTETALQRALKLVNTRVDTVPVKDAPEGLEAVLAGKADAFAGDRVVLAGLKRDQPKAATLDLLASDFSYEPYALVVRRDDPDFRLALNRALVGVYKSGEIDGIYQRWLAPLGQPSLLLHSMFYLNALPE